MRPTPLAIASTLTGCILLGQWLVPPCSAQAPLDQGLTPSASANQPGQSDNRWNGTRPATSAKDPQRSMSGTSPNQTGLTVQEHSDNLSRQQNRRAIAPFSALQSQVVSASGQSAEQRAAAVVTSSYQTPSTAPLAPSNSARTPLQRKSSADDPQRSQSSGGVLQMLLSIGSSLAVVIGLFLAVALLYRKSMAATMGRGLPKNVVQVLGRTTVAPRQQLMLLRFGSKLVLVSLIQGDVRTLSEITDPLEVDQLAGFCESSQSGSSSQGFRELLVQGAKA